MILSFHSYVFILMLQTECLCPFSPQFMCWNPNLQFDGGFGGLLNEDFGKEDGAPMNGISTWWDIEVSNSTSEFLCFCLKFSVVASHILMPCCSVDTH